MRGRRLGIVGRVAAHGLVLLVLMTAFMMAGFRLAIAPVLRQNHFSGWLVQHAAMPVDDRAELARELDRTRAQIGAEVSVYDAAGALVASNVTPPLTAPAAERAEALRTGRAVHIAHDCVVGPLRRGESIVGHAVMRHHPPAFPVGRGLLVLGVSLALAALASMPLARSLTRPIIALEAATRRLGGGDLTTRVALDRSDEIGDLARAFDHMAARIASFVRAEKELLANVSHELRTPLSRIRVVLELASDGDPARAQRYLPEIAQDLAELDRLVEDVLTTAKLDLAEGKVGSGQVPMRAEELAAEDLVTRSRTRFSGLYPERSLTTAVGSPLPLLRGDPVMLRRVIDNLLDNAVKHAPAPAKVALSLRAVDGGAAVEIEVKDDGPGMAANVAARAFEPFYRGDASRDRRTGGVGLGLSLVKRIVEAHGGRLTLVTAPGEGTAITARLPAA